MPTHPDSGCAARAAFAALLVLLAGCSSAPPKPRPMPPEVLNPEVTPANVRETICRPDYVAAQQPGAAERRMVERDLLQRTGTDPELAATFVIDEIVPIGLGGNGHERRNLELQTPRGEYGANNRRALARELQKRVCTGKLDLREAQSMMWNDWHGAYREFVPVNER